MSLGRQLHRSTRVKSAARVIRGKHPPLALSKGDWNHPARQSQAVQRALWLQYLGGHLLSGGGGVLWDFNSSPAYRKIEHF